MKNVATIRGDAQICTLINTFASKPNRQKCLVESLRSFTFEVARSPGFVAASVHVEVDGGRVANYVQWQSREHLEAMLRTDAARRHLAEVGALAESVTPILYDVAFVAASHHEAI